MLTYLFSHPIIYFQRVWVVDFPYEGGTLFWEIDNPYPLKRLYIHIYIYIYMCIMYIYIYIYYIILFYYCYLLYHLFTLYNLLSHLFYRPIFYK